MFQADLYPDTAANRPAIEADEWQTGVDADPIMVHSGYFNFIQYLFFKVDLITFRSLEIKYLE